MPIAIKAEELERDVSARILPCSFERCRKFLQRMRLRQQELDAAVCDHEAETILRIIRIERHIGPTRLQDAKQTDHHIERALDRDPDQHIRPDTQLAQMPCQLIGTPIQLTIAEALILEDDGNRIRSLPDLRLDQLMQARAASCNRLATPPVLDNLPALLAAKDLDIADRPARRLTELLKKTVEVAKQPFDLRSR